MNENKDIVQIQSLKKHYSLTSGLFKKTAGKIKAVDGVTLSIKEGETLGLVGESGCGKTTLGRCITRILKPTEGKILFKDKNNEVVDLFSINKSELRKRREDFQMIFQDPYSSLDPRMTVYNIITEPLYALLKINEKEKRDRAEYLMDIVGLDKSYLNRYPHAFSGGQRQRIGIARALATQPKFIVADEPVSALDVSVQAQILNLLIDLQQQFKLTFLFVAHNLSVVKHISTRIAVMYVGRIVEIADTLELFNNPLHPYTRALLSSIPNIDPEKKMKRILLSGEPPDPSKLPNGCSFAPRCSSADSSCCENEQELVEFTKDHFVACHKNR